MKYIIITTVLLTIALLILTDDNAMITCMQSHSASTCQHILKGE